MKSPGLYVDRPGLSSSITLDSQWCYFVYQKMTKLRQCREGLHALPKTMFDLFFKAVGGICQRLEHFQRLGHFLRKGMKPFPAQDMRT